VLSTTTSHQQPPEYQTSSPRPIHEGTSEIRAIRQRPTPVNSYQGAHISQSMPTMDTRTPEFQGLYTQLQELLQQEPHLADVADVGGNSLSGNSSHPIGRSSRQYQGNDSLSFHDDNQDDLMHLGRNDELTFMDDSNRDDGLQQTGFTVLT
jgi:hypothetical protein